VNLTKKFGNFTAVDKINLRIMQGEIFGFLGPNGAGKTTTIKMLSTLLHPSSGLANVCDYDVSKKQNDVRQCIGIVFQDPAVDDQLTGEENLDFHARMYGMDAKKRKERVDYVLKLVDLKDKAKVLVKHYSGGMRRRLEIARGLMHFPKVLFLDEPTLGLDPQTRRGIWDYIKKLNREENMTILITTHYMEEADSLCHRIGIIDHGKILITDTSENLKNIVGDDVITINTKAAGRLARILEKKGMTKKAKVHDSTLDISVKSGEKRIPEIMKIAEKEKIMINTISLRKPTLEDVFLHYTGRTIREDESTIKKDNMRRGRRMWGGRR
jgi:ABC-2 type transport system ATP-binding protein